jgi:hypothetical protein
MSDAPEQGTHALTPELSRAIDDVLVAGHSQRHWLKAGHPPFESSLAEGMAHYGSLPGAAFDLWTMCRAIEKLRLAWTGQAGPAAVPGPIEVPDEAPGLTTELARGGDAEAEQPRLPE